MRNKTLESLACLFWTGLAAVAVVALSACGGTDIRCGENTVSQNGRCVLDESQAVGCGDGATVNSQGVCVLNENGCAEGSVFSAESRSCVSGSSACGDGTSFDPSTRTCIAATECGPNTIREEDTCVVDTEAVCGGRPGLTFNEETGRCEIVQPESCGEGTEFSPDVGECVIAEDSCGAGLVIDDDGRCVPTSEICDDGTTFKYVGGQPACVPDVTCDEGDVVLDPDGNPVTPGICVSPVEKAAQNADVVESEITDETANNDPFSGGTADEVTEPSVGSSLTYTGIIQPTDQQDVDAFKFTAEEGDWFNISVQSAGLPQPWFEVHGPNGYERETSMGESVDAARNIAIPADGEYTVAIYSTSDAKDALDGPFGGEDWRYLATLEQVQPPARDQLETVDVTSNALTGEYGQLRDNFFQVEETDPQTAATQFTFDAIGDDVSGRIQTWGSPTDFIASAATDEGESVVLPTYANESAAPIVAVDWSAADGPKRSYEISADPVGNSEYIGELEQGETVSSSQQPVMADSRYHFVMDVPANQVIELIQTNAAQEPVEVEVRSVTGEVLLDESEMAVPQSREPEAYDSGYFYTSASGRYVVSVSPSSEQSLSGLEVTLEAQSPNELGTIPRESSVNPTISNAIESGRSAFHTVTLSKDSLLDISVAPQSPTSGATVDVRVRRASDYSVLLDAKSEGGVSLNREVVPAGEYILQIGAQTQVAEYQVSIRNRDVVPEVEGPDGNSRAGATRAPIGRMFYGEVVGFSDWWEFHIDDDLTEAETLLVRFISSEAQSADFECVLYDSDGNVVQGQDFSGGDLAPGGTDFDDRDYGCIIRGTGLAADTYYMHFRHNENERVHYFGSSQILEGISESESNNSKDEADSYPMSLLPTGRQGFVGWHREQFNDTDDWYQVTLPDSIPSGAEWVVGYDALGPSSRDAFNYEIHDSSSMLAEKEFSEMYTTGSISGGETYYLRSNLPEPSQSDDNGYYVSTSLFSPDRSVSGQTTNSTIPNDDASGVENTATVSNCSTAEDVFVELDITTENRGDLDIQLTGPAGQTSTLELPITDNTASEVSNLVEIYPLTEVAFEPLDQFEGQSANGTWRLNVADEVSDGSDGTLNAWQIHLNCQ